MPRKVKGPDGMVHVFPDDATDAEISAALDTIGAQGPSVMAPKPSFLDQATNWLPAIGGSVGGMVGGSGGTVAGMGVGGVPGAIAGATLGGGVGEAAKQLIDRFRGLDAPQTPLDAATSIAKEGGIQGATEAAGAGIAKGVKAGATAVYRGYLKPSLAGVKIDKAREIVQTAMSESLPVTKAGDERANRLIADLNGQVNNILSNSRGKVDLHQVAERVRDFAKRKYFRPGVDSADFKAAMDVADSIDQHPALGLPAGASPTRVEVSASQANEVKQAVRPNSRAFGQQGSAPEAATRKVAGHEMRTEIEKVAPEVGPLNAREGRLIDAQEAVKHAAGREENRSQLFGMPTLLAGAVGGGEYARSRDPASGLAMALALRAALSPALVTRAAYMASKLAKNGYTAAAAARIAVETVQSESEEQPQHDVHRQ